MSAKEITKLALFEGQEIRKSIHDGEWWFVVEDVVLALIDSKDPKQYIQRMKRRDPELGKGWVQIVHTLSIKTVGGANTETQKNSVLKHINLPFQSAPHSVTHSEQLPAWRPSLQTKSD